MSDINKQMAEFAKELWENYIKPKVGIEFSDTVSYYMATVVSNDGYNRVTIKRPFDDAYQVSCLDDMAGLEAGDTVLVLRFGSGTNNANHIVFGKGNGNMNYTAAAATATATEASVAAGQAAEAAAEAIESAGQAASAAESAQESAQQAQESANTANQAANNALIGLATVEGVVDTVNWFAEHKTASTDTSVVPSKTYYEYNPVAGTLSAVTPEGDENPSEEGWYELSEAISNYVASHVATTNDGLYVVGLSNGWKILVSSGTGTYTPGIFLIDPSGNIAQATTANGITFDDSKPFYIGDNNASIVFDGNGHISISGIGVSIGSTGSKSIDEILSELGASIKTIEYGVGNSATSHSDITSWSSNTPEWQEDKYIWQRTTTNGLTYTYTCIQGAAGEPGAPGVSVSGVTNYYLATSQSSGVTRETTGWTTSIQTMTSTNQYLWNYEVVTGSDGSTLNTTDPIIIGRYGQDGSPGGSGRGITGITEYYLVSNQQTGITPSSSGWSTTVPTTSTTTPYLWNYEVVTYTSGSPDTSSARIIGTHGETGAPGEDAYSYNLNVSSAVVIKSTSGTYNPASLVLSATRIKGAGTPSAYSGRFKIETYDGSTWTQRYPSSGSGSDQSSYTYTIPTNITITAIRCSLYLAGGSLTDARLLDQQSTPVAVDGATGADAYTVILTNENHTFAGSTTAALASSTECAVVAYKGATQVAATIGTITGQPTGMTTSLSNNGTTSAKFTVTVTTSMVTKNGVLTVPVTVDGNTFQMKFTYSLALTGATGAPGADGRMLYATSTTAAGTAAKTATLANGTLTLTAGATVAVTFTNANTAADATLNVAGTGAKTIRAGGASLTATSEYNWTAGATAIFVYDGTYWQMDGTAALDKLGSLDIGGRNLFICYDALPPSKRSINAATSYTYDPDTGTYVVKQTAASSGFVQIYSTDAVTDATQLAGKEVTLSARSITSSRAAANPRLILYITKAGGSTVSTFINKNNYKITYTLPEDTGKIGYILRLDQDAGGAAGETVTFAGVKCELGNVATDWTPAPEDTLAEIANIEVGGRNLSTGTGTAKEFTPVSGQTYFAPLGFYPVGDYGVSLIRGATTEDEWVVSFDYAVTGAATATQIYVSMNKAATSYTEISPDRASVPVGNSSGHFSTVFKLTSEQITYGNKWLLSKTNNTDSAIRVTLSNFMFEKGNRASSWSPAPEDVAEAIASVEDTATEALNKHGFCSCTTAAGTKAKTASLTDFQLKTGSTVHVTFSNANTIAGATLNINSTGAKTIKWNGESIEADKSPWAAGECVTFVYDGTYWVVAGQSNILADNIVAGSIAADRIKANVISAVNGGSGKINADKIYTEQITIGESQVQGLSTSLAGKESAVTTTTPTYDTNQTPYMLRASTKAIMGQESLDKVVGGSIGWNQIIQNGNFANGDYWSVGRGTESVSSNTLTATSDGTGFLSILSDQFADLVNRKLLIQFGFKGSKSTLFVKAALSNASVNTNNFLSKQYTGATSWIDYATIYMPTTSNAKQLRIGVDSPSSGDTMTIRNVMVSDLTLMFGTTIADYIYSLEQATAGSGITWLKQRGFFKNDFYAYNLGTISSVGGLSSHDTVGKNQFDSTQLLNASAWSEANGVYSGGIRALYDYAVTGFPTQPFWEDGVRYTVSIKCVAATGTSRFRILYKDETYADIVLSSSVVGTTQTMTTTKDVNKFLFTYNSGGSISVSDIQIEKGTTPTAYEPYVKNSYPLNSSLALRGVPTLVSNELQYDGDVYLPSGRVTRKYGIITFNGSENWQQGANNPNLFYLTLNSTTFPYLFSYDVKAISNLYIFEGAFAGSYGTHLSGGDFLLYCNGSSGSTREIAVLDLSVNTTTAFKTKIGNKPLTVVYELASQTTETAMPYQQTQMADPNGTEGFTTTSVVPVGHYTTYPTNLRGAIDSLPVDTTGAAKTATNYITNISGSGITVTGNNAVAKVQITNKVRVQADTTHFTDVESDGMRVYAGSSTVPVARFLATSSRIGSDSTHYTEFTSNSLTIAGGTDSPTITLSTYPITSSQATSSVAGIGLTSSDRTKQLITLYTSKNTYNGTTYENPGIYLREYDTGTLAVRIGATFSGSDYVPTGLISTYVHGSDTAQTTEIGGHGDNNGGHIAVFHPLASGASYAKTAIQIDARGGTLYGNKPVITFWDTDANGSLASWYGTNKAYIKGAYDEGPVVHGHTSTYEMSLDCDPSSGYVAFYGNGAVIGAIPVGSSDRRTKTDIEPVSDKYKRAVSKVELKDFRYDFTDDVLSGVNNLLRFGAIAQDVIEELKSEGIREDESELVATLSDENGERYIINYVPFLVARIAADEDRIKELEDKNAELEARLAAIEAKLGIQ